MTNLKEGDKAPEFSGTDQKGEKISLKDFAGNKLILYFYPKDDTPGCTAEACNLRDNYEALLKKGFKIVGVSKDNQSSHRKFANKYTLPFPLIADTDKRIMNKYGAWGEKQFLGKTAIGTLRTTFVISEKGIIEKVFTKIDTKNHTEQILKAINN